MKYNQEKGIEIVKYILSKGIHDMYHLLKVIYFADKYHLEHYGRQITGNTFIAMDYGPVPSEAYDMCKIIRDGIWIPDELKCFYQKKHLFFCTESPDIDMFSESDLEALDKSIKTITEVPLFSQLKEISHDEAYNNTELNEKISIESIINTFDNGKQIMEYLNR